MRWKKKRTNERIGRREEADAAAALTLGWLATSKSSANFSYTSRHPNFAAPFFFVFLLQLLPGLFPSFLIYTRDFFICSFFLPALSLACRARAKL